MEEEVLTFKSKFKQLESETETKTKDVDVAEANAVALKKQSEGFLLEYDRLLQVKPKFTEPVTISGRKIVTL